MLPAEPIGPNVKRLIAMKMAKDAQPAHGGTFGLGDAIAILSSPELLRANMLAATENVWNMIKLVRMAAEPNPWKNSTAEVIAAHILAEIEKRKLEHRNS